MSVTTKAAAIVAATFLSLTAHAGTATATQPDRGENPAGYVTFVNHEAKKGDVVLGKKKWVERAATNPRSVNATKFTQQMDYDHNRFRFVVKIDNLARLEQRGAYKTIQYVDLFVTYKQHGKRVDAFGIGTSNRHPRMNELGADIDAVSRSCYRSVMNAPVRMNFKTNVMRGSVSLDCIPVGTAIHVTGDSSMWVNPHRPPNHAVATDDLLGITFTRTAE